MFDVDGVRLSFASNCRQDLFLCFDLDENKGQIWAFYEQGPVSLWMQRSRGNDLIKNGFSKPKSLLISHWWGKLLFQRCLALALLIKWHFQVPRMWTSKCYWSEEECNRFYFKPLSLSSGTMPLQCEAWNVLQTEIKKENVSLHLAHLALRLWPWYDAVRCIQSVTKISKIFILMEYIGEENRH